MIIEKIFVAWIVSDIIMLFFGQKIQYFFETIFFKVFKRSLNARIIIDSTGIPISYDYYQGRQINPYFVARETLLYIEKYEINPDPMILTKIQNCLLYLEKEIKIKDDYAILPFKFDHPQYKMKAPWISSLGQSACLLLFARWYQLNGELRYLTLSEQFLHSFEVSETGLVFKYPDGEIAFEEYPGLNHSPCPLNGSMNTLIKIHSYYNITKNQKALILYEKGIRGLERNIHLYSFLNYSKYDLRGNMAQISYHKLHLLQLNILYKISGSQILRKYLRLWSSALITPFTLYAFIVSDKKKRLLFIIILFIILNFL